MIKGLVGGLRTLVLAFALLFVVLYIIAVFATITIGRGADLDRLDGLRSLFRRAGPDVQKKPCRIPVNGSCTGRFHQLCSQLSAAILENVSVKMGCQWRFFLQTSHLS